MSAQDAPASAAPKSGERQLPPAFATRKTDLEIPFTVTQGTTPESQASRVDVLVSWDYGRNWFKYSEVAPDAGKFRFVAKKDMEFWFLTQTIDKSGRTPQGDVKWPQLRLIVDTQKPELKMTALVNPSGQPEVSWTVTDTTLNPGSLKIEYQDAAGSDENWQTIDLSTKENVIARGGLVGKKMLALPPELRAINLRAEVSDVAGNKSFFSQHLVLPSASELAKTKATREQSPDLADASARRWPSDNKLPSRGLAGGANDHSPAQETEVVQEEIEAGDPTRKTDGEPEPKLVENPFAGKGRLAALPRKDSDPDVLPPAGGGAAGRELSEGSQAESMPPPKGFYREQEDALPPAEEREPLPAPRSGPPLHRHDDVGPVMPEETGPDSVDSPEPGESIPAGDRPRLSNIKRFNLDYDVESVGPEGVAEVELWGTNDGGKTWIRWGTDPDRTSPMEVEVSNEIVYGFRVVIVGKNGLVGNRPQSGDEADIWVEIDATRPSGRITSAAYGTGEHAGELDIRWEAHDEHLGPRPVTLSFSDRPDGKFTTIAAGLSNSGQYFWQFDPRSPRQLYLRLDVRDDAGNVTSDVLADPINIEGLTPKGRIRSFSPAADPGARSGRAPFQSPLFK